MIDESTKNELRNEMQEVYDSRHTYAQRGWEHDVKMMDARLIGLMSALEILCLDYGIDEEGKAYVR